jgi:hypothetical protein
MLFLEQNFDPQIKNVATNLLDTADIHHYSLLSSKLQFLPAPKRTIAINLDRLQVNQPLIMLGLFLPKISPGDNSI